MDNREVILETALELFYTRGYDVFWSNFWRNGAALSYRSCRKPVYITEI